MERAVSFNSNGLKLSGALQVPAGAAPSVGRPGVILLHGFGSNKEAKWMHIAVRLLADWGYATLRFDMRGCGESEGERGRVICLEQVEDAKAAVTYMQGVAGIDPQRVAVFGLSFGAAVAVYVAGVDPRIAACISAGGWGNGEKKFQRQHEGPEAWKKFTDMMAEGRRRKALGEQMMVPRFDIVPIPQHMRANLSKGSHQEFPFDVVESMYTFMANDVVGRIAPRPLLLMHPSEDTVTPTEQSVELFQRAGQPTDLFLVSNTDHFILYEGNAQVIELLRLWFERNFPVQPGPKPEKVNAPE